MRSIDPTPFLEIAPRGGRPRIARELRQYFCGCRVTPATNAQIEEWCEHFACSRGLLLDQLVAFALVRGFVRSTSKTKKKHGH